MIQFVGRPFHIRVQGLYSDHTMEHLNFKFICWSVGPQQLGVGFGNRLGYLQNSTNKNLFSATAASKLSLVKTKTADSSSARANPIRKSDNNERILKKHFLTSPKIIAIFVSIINGRALD